MVKAKFPVFNEEAYLAETGVPLDEDLDQLTNSHPTVTLTTAQSAHPGHIDIIIEGPDRDTVIKAIAGFFSVFEWAVGEGDTFDIQIEWV